MNTLCFSEIPQKYDLEIRNITDKVIQNLYSKFNYLYFRSSLVNSKDDKENLIEPFIYNSLKDYKFITYYMIDKHESQNDQIISSNSSSHPIDVIFCVEQKCLIIKKIKISTIIKIINKLKAAQASIINITRKSSIFTKDLIEEETLDFIDNFCLRFRDQINKKKYIKKTIFPLVGYIQHIISKINLFFILIQKNKKFNQISKISFFLTKK